MNLSDYDEFMENELGILNNIHKIFSTNTSETSPDTSIISEQDDFNKKSLPEKIDANLNQNGISEYASQYRKKRGDLHSPKKANKKTCSQIERELLQKTVYLKRNHNTIKKDDKLRN